MSQLITIFRNFKKRLFIYLIYYFLDYLFFFKIAKPSTSTKTLRFALVFIITPSQLLTIHTASFVLRIVFARICWRYSCTTFSFFFLLNFFTPPYESKQSL